MLDYNRYRDELVQATVSVPWVGDHGHLALDMLIHSGLVSLINCYKNFRSMAVNFEGARP